MGLSEPRAEFKWIDGSAVTYTNFLPYSGECHGRYFSKMWYFHSCFELHSGECYGRHFSKMEDTTATYIAVLNFIQVGVMEDTSQRRGILS